MRVSVFLIFLLIISYSGSKKVIAEKVSSQNTSEAGITSQKDSIITASQNNDKEISFEQEKETDTTPITINEFSVKSEENIHDLWNKLLIKNVSGKGNVDYQGFKKDWDLLLKYISILGENIPDSKSSKEEKLAYWINAYNAFTIDLILRNYPLESIKDIKDPWGQRLWELGDKWYNLEEIEHQILRKMDEPRIHFAIVCASYSCPKLQNTAFIATHIDDQLNNATKEFLNDPERNTISENNLQLSKIFQWFSKDFKQNGSLIDFLNRYSDMKISNDAKISYKKYNWDLND